MKLIMCLLTSKPMEILVAFATFFYTTEVDGEGKKTKPSIKWLHAAHR